MRCLESPSSIQLTAVREENLRAEDSRVKSLVKRILVEDEEPVIGLVAHSILFKRMIQLFWPKDRLRQEELRTALRNGAQKQDTVDPFEDKVMNCGTLVLTFRYHSGGCPWVVPQMYVSSRSAAVAPHLLSFSLAVDGDGQTLLQFVTDHDDKLKQVEKHGVKLPDTVQGWHLLTKSGLTREQKQMIMTQSASLERAKVQQAMYAILGQDYKGGGQSVNSRWQRPFNSTGKGRGYFAGDDAADPTWDSPSVDWEPEDEGTFEDFLTEEHIYHVEEVSEDQGSLMPVKRWKTLISNSQTQLNRLHAYVDNDYTPSIPDEDLHMTPAEHARAAFRKPESPETFQQQRMRLDRQETMSFGPQRTARASVTPYTKPPQPENAETVFEIEDLDSESLPSGWTFNHDSKTLELKSSLKDFWEIKGGCLIRHHVNPRSKLFDIRDRRDLPVPVEHLDDVQVTVYREPGSNPHSVTNHFKTENIFKSVKNSKNPSPVPKKWIGQTIFQITAVKRQEWGMTSSSTTTSATSMRFVRKAAQSAKTHHIRQVKKDKGEVREKNLNAAELQLFYEEIFDFRTWQEDSETMEYCGENSDVTLRYEPFESIQSWQDLSKARLSVMFDAAHAVREDHSSQGGYIAFITPDTVFHEETSYHVVDWRSFKLHRVARSSLSAEAQAAGQASDASEYIARFWSCIMNPNVDLRDRLQEKFPVAAMVCYTQIKAVMADDYFIQAVDDNVCPVEQEYFWSPLTVLCTLLMLLSAILSLVTYKLGRFLERRHWRSLVNTRIRVTTGRHERHELALKNQLQDLHLQSVEKVCELEEKLAELSVRNDFLRKENDAVLAENHADQDELAELHERHRRSCALFTRAFREIQGHLEDCPLEHGVVATPFGAAWHTEESCRGVARSGRVTRRHVCNFCCPGVQTPHVTNSVSGTTLFEDFQEFIREEGRCSYEEWIVD
ncbi:unnamed protein product [Durusdinium trenchii]|uniref:WW domain-containing protein n=1 Tax=Durusdinium trenchii TaxID=1381693 RepID=A0ABP0JZL1_9DINO